MTRLRHWWLAVTALPLLIFNPRSRSLFTEMRTFCQSLPVLLKAPLRQTLSKISSEAASLGPNSLPEPTIRLLADLTALLERASPLGLCLRRSLTRYYFLRRNGVPVVLQFGARFVSGKPDREVTGHAWLTLNGQPYYEDGEDYQGFAVMLSFPS